MQNLKEGYYRLLKSLNNKANRKLLAIIGLAFICIVASIIFFGQNGADNLKIAKAGSCDIVNQAEIVVGGVITTTSTVIDQLNCTPTPVSCPLVNNASVTADGATQANANVTNQVNCTPDIDINKVTQSPKSFKADTEYYYNITFKNTGVVTLKDINIVDTLNSNLSFSGNTCNDVLRNIAGGTSLPFAYTNCVLNSTAGTLSFDYTGNLNVSQEFSFRVLAKIKTGSAINIDFNNVVVITGKSVVDDTVVNAQSQDVVRAIDYALGINKTPSAYTFEINQANPAATNYTYFLDYENSQTTALTGVVISDTLDSKIKFIANSCAGGNLTSTGTVVAAVSCTLTTDGQGRETLTWNVGNMPANSKGRVSFRVNFTDSYPFAVNEVVPNTAIIDSVETPADQDSAYVNVRYTNPDVNITKNTVNDQIYFNNGDTVVYPITFANTRTQPLTGVYITDVLDPRLNFSSCTGSCTYTAATRTVRWDVGNLAVGESRTYNLSVVVNGTGVINNKATIFTNETDPDFDDVNIIITPLEFEIKIVKYSSESTVRRGETYTYTLDYFNPSDITPLSSVVITDVLDSKITFAGASTCSGGTKNSTGTIIAVIPCTLSTNAGVQTLTWNVGGLTPGQTGQVQFDVTVKADAALQTIPNTAVIDSAETDPDQSTVFVDVVDYALGINKTPSAYTFEINQANPAATNYTYFLDYENSQTTALTGVVISDTLDSKIKFIANSCAGGNLTSTGTVVAAVSCTLTTDGQGRETLTWNVGNMPANSKGRVSFRVNFTDSYPFAVNEVVPNTAIIDSVETPADQDSAYVNVRYTNPDVNITKNTVNDQIYFNNGDTVVYPIAFANTRTQPLTGVYITDVLDPRLNFSSCTGSCTYTAATRTVRWEIGGLAVGESRTYNLTVTINGTGVINNKATIFTNETDPDFDDVNIIITPLEFEIKIVKYSSESTVRRGETYTYTLDYFNPSDITPLSSVVITDVLDSKITFAGASTCSGGTKNSTGTIIAVIPCTLSTNAGVQTLTWNVGGLTPGQTGQVQFDVTVKADAALQTIPNTAVIDSAETDPDQSTVFVDVVDYALGINKTPSAYTFEINQANPAATNYTYFLDYENSQTTALTGVVISDTLDSKIKFIANSCAGGNLTSTGTVVAAVSCTLTTDGQGRETLTWNVGNMPANSKGRVSFRVNFTDSYPFAVNEVVPNTAIIDSVETPADQDSAYVNVRYTNPDVNITKNTVNDQIYFNNGDTVVYPIAFANTRTQPLTGVYITDVLDPRLNFSSCTGSCTYTAATRTVRWEIGGLAVGESRTYNLTVTINGTGVINNKATIFTNETDPDFDDVNIIITPLEFEIKIVKYSSESTVRRGETYTYTLDYFNPSDITPLSSVVITDVLDSKITFAGASTCSGGTKNSTGTIIAVIPCTLSTNAGVQTLTWNVGGLTPGQTGQVQFDVTVKADAALQTIPNTAVIDSAETDPDQSTVFVDVVDYALGINKTPSAYTFEINQANPAATNYTYFLDYENSQTTALTGVVISDTLDSKIKFIANSCAGGNLTSTGTVVAAVSCTLTTDGQGRETLTWNVGNMPANSKGRVSFRVNFTDSYPFAVNEVVPNTAIIDSVETPADQDSAYVNVRYTNPDVNITKNTVNDQIYFNNGDTVVYPIAFANTRTQPLTGVYITDVLDPRLNFSSCTGSCTYTAATRTVRWEIGGLAVGESRTYNLTVTINGTGVINNKATIFTNETDPDFDDVNIIITPLEFEIKIVKYSSESTVRRGETYTYTLDYFNPSDITPLSSVVITDVLDSKITFAGASTCSGGTKNSTGTIIAVIPCTLSTNAGVQTLTWNVGGLTPGQTGQVQFDVTVKADAALQTIPNTAVIDSAETDPDQSTVFVDVVDYALGINKTPSAYTFEINQANPAATNYTYFLDYENSQTTALTGVVISDTLDSKIKFIANSCAGGNLTSTGTVVAAVSCTLTTDGQGRETLTWNVGNMPANSKGRVSFRVNFTDSYPFAVNEVVPNTAIIDSVETPADQDSAYVNVRYTNPDVNITKNTVNDQIYFNNGDTVVYPIAFANTRTQPLTGVYITDVLDPRLNFSSCTGSCTYTAATRTVRWEIGGLAVGESRTYNLTVTINGTGVINNKATIFTNETDPDFDDVNIIITPLEFEIKIVKYSSESTVRRGETYTYTLDYFNPSDITPLSSVVITDVLDSKITFAGASTCSGGTKNSTGTIIAVIPCTLSTNAGVQTLTWNVGGLTPGQTGQVQFDVTVKADAALQTIPNTAVIDSAETDPDQSTVFVDVVDYALGINKTPSAYTFEINQANPAATNYTYFLDYENSQTTALTGVVISDTLDSKIKFIANSCAGGNLTSTGTVVAAVSCTLTTDGQGRETLTWNVGNMPANSKGRVSFRVNFTDSYPFAVNEVVPNTAIIDSVETPADQDSAYVNVRYTNPDVNITKNTVNDQIYFNNGDTVVYPIAFANTRTQPLTGVYITDVLDPRLNFSSCTGSCTYTAATRTVRWEIGTLAVGESRTLI